MAVHSKIETEAAPVVTADWSQVTLAGKATDWTDLHGPAGLLFECAPDSAARRRMEPTLSIEELIGDFDAIKASAVRLARKLIEGEPVIEGAGHLRIFEEPLIRALQTAFHTLALRDALEARGVRECVFGSASRFARTLDRLHRLGGTGFAVRAPREAPALGSIRRSWNRLRQDNFNLLAMRRELREVRRRIDPYSEMRIARRYPRVDRDKTWFYSTALNFTRIGLLYEPYFPEAFRYLVENPLNDAQPLKQAGRGFLTRHDFAQRDMIPSPAQIEDARRAIRRHVADFALSAREAEARELLFADPFMETFLARHLPIGMFDLRLFDRFIERAEPRAIVTGNPVFEGYALSRARRAGIPSVVLQHGILGDFCQFTDPPVEHYVVRGTFWRDFLDERPRRRAIVANPPAARSASRPSVSARRDTITYISNWYESVEFLHQGDLLGILRTLVEAARRHDGELAIRVHPCDSPGEYRKHIAGLTAGTKDVRVTFSQGAGLEELLRRSAVAVLHASTVFLECVRLHVPIVSPGWQDFSYKRLIREHGVFHFACDLNDLERLVGKALRGEIPAFDSDAGPFLADMPEAEVRDRLGALVAAR